MFIENPIKEDYSSLVKTLSDDFKTISVKYGKTTAKIQLKSTIDIYNKLHNLVESLNYLPGKIEKTTDRLIESSEKLSRSNEKYLFWQTVLTGALVLATIGLIIATLFLAFK